MFSPRDVELVAGAPSERRRFLDIVLALTSRRYLTALQQYRAALVRRNAALRDAARTWRAAGWRAPPCGSRRSPSTARVLWSARVAWVERCADAVRDAVRERSASAATRGCATRPPPSTAAAGARGASIPDLAAHLADALAAHRAADLRRGLTHAGPHRDDLDLTLDGHRAARIRLGWPAAHGSDRAAAARGRYASCAPGSAPLVLLDDPFAELDAHRAARILELLGTSGVGIRRFSRCPEPQTFHRR